jgi:hypothetical protein
MGSAIKRLKKLCGKIVSTESVQQHSQSCASLFHYYFELICRDLNYPIYDLSAEHVIFYLFPFCGFAELGEQNSFSA